MTTSWKDPWKKQREAEKADRDWKDGYADGNYSRGGQTCSMRSRDKWSAAYIKGFKEASGYTPDQWSKM